jgi:hypothetical protein
MTYTITREWTDGTVEQAVEQKFSRKAEAIRLAKLLAGSNPFETLRFFVEKCEATVFTVVVPSAEGAR